LGGGMGTLCDLLEDAKDKSSQLINSLVSGILGSTIRVRIPSQPLIKMKIKIVYNLNLKNYVLF